MSDIKEKLILEVQNCPEIWDKRHKNHHNRYILKKKWTTIAAQLGCTDGFAKSTWKYLRQEFAKKWTKTKSGDIAPNETSNSWPYFESLLFLKDQFLPRQIHSNLVEENENPEFNEDTFSHENEEFPTTDSLASQSAPSTPEGMFTPVSAAGYQKRTTVEAAIGQSLLQLEREKLEMKRARSFIDPNDEDVGFFNSLLPHVKKLDTQTKMQFRMEVQRLLYNFTFPSQQNVPSLNPTIPLSFSYHPPNTTLQIPASCYQTPVLSPSQCPATSQISSSKGISSPKGTSSPKEISSPTQ